MHTGVLSELHVGSAAAGGSCQRWHSLVGPAPCIEDLRAHVVGELGTAAAVTAHPVGHRGCYRLDA